MVTPSEKIVIPSLYILRFETTSRRDEILRELEDSGYVGESVESFLTKGTGRLYAAVILDNAGQISHICRMLRYGSEVFRRITVGLTAVESISSEDAQALASGILFARATKRRDIPLNQLGRLQPEENRRVIESLDASTPHLSALLRNKGQASDRMLRSYSEHEKEIVSLERDSLGLALEIAFDDREALAFDGNPKEKFGSFLDMLGQTRYIEDEVVPFDLERFPGLDAVLEANPRTRVFEHNGSRLEVIHANRNDLEHTLGVDLIYVSHYFGSFVGIQYKMLEGDAREYAPDRQFREQLARMNLVQRQLRPSSESEGHLSYRLNGGAFFFKFVSRLEQNFAHDSLCPGMYLPMELVNRIASKPPSRFGYERTRHLSNSEFANLFREGWVGTSETNTNLIKQAVKEALDQKRSLTIAVDRRSDARMRGRRKASLAKQLS